MVIDLKKMKNIL